MSADRTDVQTALLDSLSVAFCRARFLGRESSRLTDVAADLPADHPARDVATLIADVIEQTRDEYDTLIVALSDSLLLTGLDILDGALAATLAEKGWQS